MTKKVEEKDTKKALTKPTKLEKKQAKLAKKQAKLVVKQTSKKDKKNKKKGNIFTKLFNYLKDVRNEMIKVRWPSKKEMLLYSGATLGFIVIFALFFMLNDVVISAVKQLVR